MEESQKTELSAWDRRVVEADSVALHPWETGRDMTEGMAGVRLPVCVRTKKKECRGKKEADIWRKRDSA